MPCSMKYHGTKFRSHVLEVRFYYTIPRTVTRILCSLAEGPHIQAYDLLNSLLNRKSHVICVLFYRTDLSGQDLR